MKTIKRFIASNTGVGGTLETDALAAALLTYRNTPDRDTGLSPAQVLFARQLRDTVPSSKEGLKLRPEWVLTLDRREEALAKRHRVRGEELTKGSKVFTPLTVGQTVQVQNQRGPHSNKWDLSGTVIEVGGYDSYTVKMDGSGRVTRRNRQYLKPIRGYMELLAESQKRLRGATKIVSVPGDMPASARGGNHGSGPPPPIGVPTILRSGLPGSSYLPGGSSAVAGSGESPSTSGPRNTELGMSSSPAEVVQQNDDQGTTQDGIRLPQVDVSRTTSVDQVHAGAQSDTVISQGQYVRPKHSIRPPNRLVVGDPNHPRFNRTMQ